jgi:hypothetical protein
MGLLRIRIEPRFSIRAVPDFAVCVDASAVSRDPRSVATTTRAYDIAAYSCIPFISAQPAFATLCIWSLWRRHPTDLCLFSYAPGVNTRHCKSQFRQPRNRSLTFVCVDHEFGARHHIRQPISQPLLPIPGHSSALVDAFARDRLSKSRRFQMTGCFRCAKASELTQRGERTAVNPTDVPAKVSDDSRSR